MRTGWPPKPTCQKTTQDKRCGQIHESEVVMISEGRAPSARPRKPAISAPTRQEDDGL